MSKHSHYDYFITFRVPIYKLAIQQAMPALWKWKWATSKNLEESMCVREEWKRIAGSFSLY